MKTIPVTVVNTDPIGDQAYGARGKDCEELA